jgi:hypothetical protein
LRGPVELPWRADAILRPVGRPGVADASFQGTVDQWVRGRLDLRGTKPAKIGGSLTLLDPAKRPLWSAAGEQWDRLRLMADGLFATWREITSTTMAA